MDLTTLPRPLQWVLTAAQKGIENREPAIQDTVRKLREEFPGATSEELARTLIKRQRRQVTITSAASGAVSAVPGLGPLAVVGIGTAQSVYALKQELELVLSVGLIYGHLPSEHEDRTLEALVVIGLAGGAIKVRDDLLIAGTQRLAMHLLTTYPRLLLTRAGGGALIRILTGAVGAQVGTVVARVVAAPIAVGLGAGFDWVTVTALGNAAIRYYGPHGPVADRLPVEPASGELPPPE